MITTVIRTTQRRRLGAFNANPSTAERTETAGVNAPSPRHRSTTERWSSILFLPIRNDAERIEMKWIEYFTRGFNRLALPVRRAQRAKMPPEKRSFSSSLSTNDQRPSPWWSAWRIKMEYFSETTRIKLQMIKLTAPMHWDSLGGLFLFAKIVSKTYNGLVPLNNSSTNLSNERTKRDLHIAKDDSERMNG